LRPPRVPYQVGLCRSSWQVSRAQGARSRCVRSVSASQHSVNEHSYPRLLPDYRHRFFIGRVLSGLPPTKTGDLCVSRRTESLQRIEHVPWGRFSPNPRPSFDRASDVPVAILFDTGARLFAVRAVPIRGDSPRPLPPHRRDAMKLFPVRNAFPRQEMRCSSSGLSTGDRAPTHQNPTRGFDSVPRYSPGPFRAVLQHLAIRSSTLCHLRLPLPRVASQRGGSFRSAGRMNSGRDFERLSSEGQAPVHRVLHRPKGRMRMEKGLLWAEPLVDFCNETIERTSTSTRPPPHPPQELVLVAKPAFPKRFRIVRPPSARLPW